MASTDIEKAPLLENEVNYTTNPSAPEPTLHELQQNVFKAQRAYMRAWSRSTSGKWHKRIMFSVTGLLLFFLLFCLGIIAAEALSDDEVPTYDSGRVQLEAFIMSKCPDARDCLHDMVLPAMQNVSHKVDFRLDYIGSATEGDDGVSCMHGPQECLGNILELCAAHLYPSPKIHLGFTMCMSNNYDQIPERELVQECALEHGISFDSLNECATREDGAVGADMLKKSFNRTQEAGVQKSCTVKVGGEVFVVRDGGEWKEVRNGTSAESLVQEVQRLWRPSSLSYGYGDW